MWAKNLKKKLKMLQKLNCDKTQKLNYDKTQKLKLWQLKNSNDNKTNKKSNCDKTQIKTKLKSWQNSNCDQSQVVTNLNYEEEEKN